MTDYAKALVEHPRWPKPWPKPVVDDEGIFAHSMRRDDAVPNLEHPATKGWLLHMLREAHGDECHPDMCARYDYGHEGVSEHWYAGEGPPCATEGEALAAALLAVWSRRPAKVDDLGTDADRKPRTF